MPPMITTGDVARACGVTWKQARGWLRRAGVLEKQGARYIAHESSVRERLPDIYQRVYAYFVFGAQ